MPKPMMYLPFLITMNTVEFEQDFRPGKYRHFKGMEYQLIGIARHSETLEPMVVYRALYGEGGLWVRPASMWNETVQVNGVYMRRFSYVGPAGK